MQTSSASRIPEISGQDFAGSVVLGLWVVVIATVVVIGTVVVTVEGERAGVDEVETNCDVVELPAASVVIVADAVLDGNGEALVVEGHGFYKFAHVFQSNAIVVLQLFIPISNTKEGCPKLCPCQHQRMLSLE